MTVNFTVLLLLTACICVLAAGMFAASTRYWLDAREQRRRALAEMRVARRLRAHADKSWEQYLRCAEESMRLHVSLADAWNRMYGTPFPVPKPKIERKAN